MLQSMIAIMWCWTEVFSQHRTAIRAIRQALLLTCVVGRRTIARSWLLQEDQRDWSSEYKLYSRSQWKEQDLFDPIIKEAIKQSDGKYLSLAIDDTRIGKTGKKIKNAHYGRDAL